MPIDPQVRSFLEAAKALDEPPLYALSPDEARRVGAANAEAMGPAEPMAQTHDTTVPGPGGEIPIRVYVPEGTGWFWECYLEREEDGRHPYASPLQADDLRRAFAAG